MFFTFHGAARHAIAQPSPNAGGVVEATKPNGSVPNSNGTTVTPAKKDPSPQTSPKSTFPSQEKPATTVGSSDTNQPVIPEFHLSQVHIDANVINDRVNIEATVDIVVNRGDGWHSVPLKMGQAHVWRRSYEGPGEELPDLSTESADDGLFWLIRGIGQHRLKLSMWVPVRKSLSGTQFQLSLPTLLPAFETQVDLTIPDENVVLRASKNVFVLDVDREESQTRIGASVSGTRLDMSWHSPTNNGSSVSLVNSRYHLKPSDDRLTMIANQTIEFSRQTSQQLDVRLPSQFSLVGLSGPHYRSHEPIPDRDGWIRIQLGNEVINQIELHWVLEALLPEDGTQLTIDGLNYDGAVREEGMVRLDPLEGFRFQTKDAESKFVHRINTTEVKNFGAGSILSAFAYFKQPFQLVLDITPTKAFFIAQPRYEFTVRDDEHVLTVDTLVQVSRGNLNRLEFDWSELSSGGWEFDSWTTDETLLGQISPRMDLNANTVSFSWPNEVSDDFRLSATFRRQRDAGAPIETELPVVRASRTLEPLIVLRAVDHLKLMESDFAFHHKPVALDEIPKLSDETAEANEREDEENVAAVRLTSGAPKFSALFSAQERLITTSSLVKIQRVTEKELAVRQSIDFDITYGRMREIALTLPKAFIDQYPQHAINESVAIQLDDQQLSGIYVGGVLHVQLPTPRKGKFRLDLDYGFPVDVSAGASSVDLPLIGVADTFRSIRCEISPVESVEVRPQSGWDAVRSAVWVAQPSEEPIDFVPVTIDLKLANSSQQFVVERAWYRTRYLPDGRSETWAEYRVNVAPSRMVLTFPSKAELNLLQCLVNGVPLDPDAIENRPGDVQTMTLILPEAAGENTTISLVYRPKEIQNFRFAQKHSVPFPRFPSSVWVNETIWEAQLPSDQHLFTYPELDPQFQWTRNAIFWSRRPSGNYIDEKAETEARMPKEFRSLIGNFYAFRGFGPVDRVEFHSMNRSMILLVGAGLTLLMGFVFWNVPTTRNVFSLVVLAFVFSVASLWYLEPIQLLIQPAVLGMALALTATFFESRSRKPDPSDIQDSGDASTQTHARDPVIPTGPTQIFHSTGSSQSIRP